MEDGGWRGGPNGVGMRSEWVPKGGTDGARDTVIPVKSNELSPSLDNDV